MQPQQKMFKNLVNCEQIGHKIRGDISIVEVLDSYI